MMTKVVVVSNCVQRVESGRSVNPETTERQKGTLRLATRHCYATRFMTRFDWR
jgi:hypothetical protein